MSANVDVCDVCKKQVGQDWSIGPAVRPYRVTLCADCTNQPLAKLMAVARGRSVRRERTERVVPLSEARRAREARRQR